MMTLEGRGKKNAVAVMLPRSLFCSAVAQDQSFMHV